MNILKVIDLLSKAGTFLTIVGELLKRFGPNPTSNLDEGERSELDDVSRSQESSNSRRVEDEKPAEESTAVRP